MRRLIRRLKHFFFAHKGNKYRPGLFARESVAIIAFTLLLLEGIYLVQIQLQNNGFTASVLPAALTTLTNADRGAQGLAGLIEDPALDKIAQAKAEDMAANGYFAHVSPDGKTPWFWLDQEKYPYTYAGENLAVDFTDSTDVENAWMNSPMHRANILKAEYTHVGIGVAQGVYEGKEVTFVAQFFATKRGERQPALVRAQDVQNIPATEPAEIAKTESPRVLGVETEQAEKVSVRSAPGDSAAVLATSPHRTMWYLIVGFTAVVAFFFALTLLVHSRKRLLQLEVMGGGAALIAVSVLLLYYNAASPVSVPADGQAASVVLAL